ncbi:hypothetical protein STAFG_5958 [Streptomyces afghaniensis 772]|uniref:Transcription regulator PadR C-terminal domain-containing protein n=1 Tax=Streptomyces afghaniensis 772 TaxID=1283301 RepID=S4MTP9_9ACTN|nr:hypothetical protein STAFG_5958 [Streptomyces afghaniensis 772]
MHASNDLRAFAGAPPRRPTAIRDELLIKIQAMDGADPEATRALVEEREAWPGGSGQSRPLRARPRTPPGSRSSSGELPWAEPTAEPMSLSR